MIVVRPRPIIHGMRITIVYDNVARDPAFRADWGFAALVETSGPTILFDTGAKGSILMDNMEKLAIDPAGIDAVFVSHGHWDHTGGLADFLQVQPTTVFLPPTCPPPQDATRTVFLKQPTELFRNVFSTGQLAGIEQSLVVRRNNHTIVIAGCSHPGVGTILSAAARFGPVHALIGGLHGFDDFSLIERLEAICPVHCTRHIDAIKRRYPDRYLAGGAGSVIDL